MDCQIFFISLLSKTMFAHEKDSISRYMDDSNVFVWTVV